MLLFYNTNPPVMAHEGQIKWRVECGLVLTYHLDGRIDIGYKYCVIKHFISCRARARRPESHALAQILSKF